MLQVLPPLSLEDSALFFARAGAAAYDASIIGWKVSTTLWCAVLWAKRECFFACADLAVVRGQMCALLGGSHKQSQHRHWHYRAAQAWLVHVYRSGPS